MDDRPAILGRILVALILVLGSLVGNPAQATTTHHGHGLSIAPAGLVSAIAKTQAKEAAKDPGYRIASNGCASLKTGAKGQSLNGCFTTNGPSFKQGKNQIDLHLVAWGSKGNLHPVSLHRTSPRANRITYQGKDIQEWWRVLPMGYEQGFTINKGPKGNGQVLLQLHSNRTPAIHHNTLAWGNLHYGKLRVIDAKGKTLPSHLTAHGKTVTLAFNASHASFPVTVDPMVWFQTQALTDPAGKANDQFGTSLALSSAGTIALVGAGNVDGGVGAAYVFTQSGGSWTLTTTFADPVTTGYNYFGDSVALSGDGSTALVGAWGTNSIAGAAYVYTQSAGSWSGVTGPTATFPGPATGSAGLGSSVALDGTGVTALVGAFDVSSSAGAAYVYTQSGGSWGTTPSASFIDPVAKANDYFGSSVALSGDGTTALVGAYGTSGPTSGNSSGAAYVYTQSGGSWSGVTTPTTTFNDPGDKAYDYFGTAVALNSAGVTALVGANGSASYAGAAYVYTQSAGSWVTIPTTTFADPDNGFDDEFGSSTALSGDGGTALVGAYQAPYDSTAGTAGPGEAYLYSQSGGSWSGVTTPTTTFTDPAASAGDYFGVSVALDGTGVAALVGVEGAAGLMGTAYSYTTPSNLSATLTVPAKVDTSTQYDAVYSITNSSTSTSADVQVQLPVPSGATYVSVTSSPGSCTYDSTTQIATCDLGTISGGSGSTSATLTLNSGATKGITLTQTASLTNGSPNLAKSASTSVSGGGGGGAFGLLSLLGLIGLAGFGRTMVRKKADS